MNWKIIIPWTLAVICSTILIYNFVKPIPKQDTKYLDLYLASKDKEIERIKEDAKKWEDHYNNDIAESKRVDSLLIQRSKVNTIKYAQVPVNVANLNNEELRAAVWDY